MKKRCNCHDWTRIDSFCCPVHGIQNWFRQGDKMTYRERLLKIARKKKLGDLAKQVVFGVYKEGIEDEVLIERCVEADNKLMEVKQ